jgi:hypothetical protein
MFTFYTRNHLGSTPIVPSHPYSPECVEGCSANFALRRFSEGCARNLTRPVIQMF